MICGKYFLIKLCLQWEGGSEVKNELLKAPYNGYQARPVGLGGQAYHEGQEGQGGQAGLPYQTWDYDREDYSTDQMYEKSNYVENDPSRYQTTFMDNNREIKNQKYAKK